MSSGHLRTSDRVVVRPATDGDVSAIRTVVYETWPVTYAGLRTPDGIRGGLATWWSAEAIRESVAAGQELVATVEDVVVGVARHDRLAASYAPRPDWADVPVLWCLYVLPAWHGVGAGKALLRATLDAVRESAEPGRPRLVLDCVDGNEPATTFYLRQGFQPVIARPAEPDEPAYHWYALPADD